MVRARIDELETLDGIKRGLTDVEARRVTPLRQFEESSGKNVGRNLAGVCTSVTYILQASR